MLVLSRGMDEAIRIGSEVRIVILETRGSRVRIGIEAPKDVRILRDELEPSEDGRSLIREERRAS